MESAEKLCEEFNTLVNELKKDEKISEKEKYPWLEDSDERKYMTDREILDKYIDLDKSCFTDSEKSEVRIMIYKYKDAFSLRDEVGTCPNIEIDINVMDKTPFFIRPYHVREEDKRILNKEMKRLCNLGILKEGFSAYSNSKCDVLLLLHLKDAFHSLRLSEIKEILRYFTMFWKNFVSVPKNAYGT